MYFITKHFILIKYFIKYFVIKQNENNKDKTTSIYNLANVPQYILVYNKYIFLLFIQTYKHTNNTV